MSLRLRCAAIVLGLAGVATAAPLDHLICSKVRERAPKLRYRVTLDDADKGARTCIVKAPPGMMCTETTTTAIDPAPPGGGPTGSEAGVFLCYAAKCPQARSGSTAVDRFGTHTLVVKGTQWLCAPATQTAVVTPPTTTTTLPSGDTCRFASGRCTGSCSGNARCGAAVGTGSCECRSVSCGDADAPQCNGACSSQGEACVFSVTGCSCVRIP